MAQDVVLFVIFSDDPRYTDIRAILFPNLDKADEYQRECEDKNVPASRYSMFYREGTGDYIVFFPGTRHLGFYNRFLVAEFEAGKDRGILYKMPIIGSFGDLTMIKTEWKPFKVPKSAHQEEKMIRYVSLNTVAKNIENVLEHVLPSVPMDLLIVLSQRDRSQSNQLSQITVEADRKTTL